jgi:hypothetical protein
MLLTAYLACVLFVTVNVLQDEMAYLLGPIVVVGVLIGVGLDGILNATWWLVARSVVFSPKSAIRQMSVSRRMALCTIGVTGLALLIPLWSLVVNWRRMDLSDFRDADEWLHRVEARFADQGQRAALLTEWERMTTVYYYAAVEGRTWDEDDLRFVPISAGTEAPFLRAADANLPKGPVYLAAYRPQVAREYRLMPSGSLWEVLPAWPLELPVRANPVHIRADEFEIVGWELSQERVQPGATLVLDLYMRITANAEIGDATVGPSPPALTRSYYLPWVRLGDTTYHFTTDSRFNTPWWQPGEIITERFELPVAWHASSGTVALQVGVRMVSEGRDLDLEDGHKLSTLTDVTIETATWKPSQRKLNRALGNLRGEILLREAYIDRQPVRALRDSGSPASAVALQPGARLRVVLEWESLNPIEENYKVFVQLLDSNLQVRAQGDDKAPLRGSAPTLLWFPRWRRGTRITDTYLLDVPTDLSPGFYPLVVGMYGFSTFRRAQVVSPDGDMEGDWITLAHLKVE